MKQDNDIRPKTTDNRPILLLANCRVEQVVIDALEEQLNCKVDLKYIDSIGEKSKNAIARHWSYMKLVAGTFFRSRNYQLIIFWQQFIALYFALFRALFFFIGLPPAIILTFIFIKRKGLKGKLHKSLYNNAVGAGFVKKIVCHSSQELKLYNQEFQGVSDNKFVFVPVGEGVGDLPFESKLGDYYFAGGSSNRDYNVLVDVFKENGKKLIVACQPTNLKKEGLPQNIQVHYNLYGDAFLKKMAGAKAVIITLKDPEISSGQLVLLNAMRLKKCCIVTEGPGMQDYTSEEYCYFVGKASFVDLNDLVKKTDNQQEKLLSKGQMGYARYKANYSYANYGKNIGLLAKSVTEN